MFIEALKKQNPRLIESAVSLWKQGQILPDSYVIDVGQVLSNGQKLVATAKQHNLSLYLMGKQFGRNPYLCQKLLQLGFDGLVAVDYKEARHYYSHNLKVSHLGHLVQLPAAMIEPAIQHQPDVITVYSIDKARQIVQAAQRLNRVQAVLIKVCSAQDIVYSGQESGIDLADLPDFIHTLQQLNNIKIAGVTHFPCILLNEQQQLVATPNFHTLIKAKQIVAKCGIEVTQVNAPSSTCVGSMLLLATMGATHGEPGHALTGTMPVNRQGDQPEKIAMLYLSEISHNFGENAYCFGGGYYRRGNAKTALVGEKLTETALLPLDADSIDYTLRLKGNFAVGDPVVMCFRTQIFVTRSDVVLIDYDQQGQPYVIGVYDSLGNLIRG